MPRLDRAAQFAPFAALTGYDEIIEESGRVTGVRAELSEDRQARISERLNILLENIPKRHEEAITFFVPDKIKAGGKYETAHGFVRHIDECEKAVVSTDDRRVLIDDIYDIEGEIFGEFTADF